MIERVAACGLLLAPLLLHSGCNRLAPENIAANHKTIPQWRPGEKAVLGSADLTAGIPGEAALTDEQIRAWLSQPGVHDPLDFALPVGLADADRLVVIPPENPLTRAKIELGRQLFFDRRLSPFGTMACATCHMPEQDYSAHAVMPGTHRNPPVCFNRIFSRHQSWNGRDESLERQVGGPVTNRLEMATTTDDCVARLQAIEGYRVQFAVIFGKLDFPAVSAALASFQRALVTGPAPWDYRRLLARFESRDPSSLSTNERHIVETLRAGAGTQPMSAAAIRGEALFFSERARCATCHNGPNLTDEDFHNVGAGMERDNPEFGRMEVTGREEHRGSFKTPTLRNVARTSPYMHNGQFDTLREVVDYYDRGAYRHESLDPAIRPLQLTRDEKRDLIAFLESLTGELPPVETGRLPE